MKRVWILSLFVLVILMSFSFLQAQTNTTEEQQKVNDAYSCLTDKVQDAGCSSLSTEEKTFSLLAVNSCRPELVSSSLNNGECWAGSSGGACSLKTTAQATLALKGNQKSESWLLNQTGIPTELIWYLQIEASTEATASCGISYSGLSYTVNIDENKKLDSNAGACLVLAEDDYWLRVAPSCYDETFSVSCNQDFLTTLLFRKSGSDTIHVSPESSSAAAHGTTTEKVESSCLTESGSCNYEGTLWGALVLDSLGKDVSEYLPYIITLKDDNRRFLPESFLYFMTSNTEYRTSLLAKQKSNKFWLESGNEFYDTAVALFPFQSENFQEKTGSKSWLLNEAQDSNGCWENNIRDTAFILASVWPRTSVSGSGGTDLPGCETSGYYCSSRSQCSGAGGEVFSEYGCSSSLQVCCSIQPQEVTCAESGGVICSSNQICRGGTEVGTSGLLSGESCCVGGTCETRSDTGTGPGQLSACEQAGNVCRSFGCNDGEETTSQSCSFTGDVCCALDTDDSGSLWWIWTLLILIVLVVVGIIFRDKLRTSWLRIKSRFRKGGGPVSSHRRTGPPGYPPYHRPHARPMQRRILLPPSIQPKPSHKPSPEHRGKSVASKELDDVLKKLKDMSK